MRSLHATSLSMWLALALSVGLGLVLLLTPVPREDFRGWDEYRILLVSAAHPLDEVYARLSSEIDGEILSAVNAQASLQSYSGIEYVAVSELAQRLDKDDLRYDEYLKKIPRYFVAEDGTERYHVLYLTREGGMVKLWMQLQRALATLEWRVVEATPVFRIVILSLLACVAVWLVCSAAKKNRWLLCVALLPLCWHMWTGNVLWSLLNLTMVFPWSFYFARFSLQRDGTTRDIKGTILQNGWGVYLAACWGAALFFVVILGRYLLLAVEMQLFLAALLYAHHELSVFRSRKREHGVFRPVRIVESSDYNVSGILMQVLASIIVILFWGTLSPLLSSEVKVPVPLERSYSLEALWANRVHSDLPTVAEYLAHEAFQESFLFGGSYSLPYEGESVHMTRFRRNGATIEKYYEILWVRDVAWFDSKMTLRRAAPTLENLFLSQGMTSIARDFVGTKALSPGRVIFLILIVLAAGLTPTAVSFRRKYPAFLSRALAEW